MGRWEAGDEEWRSEIQRGLQGSGLVPGVIDHIINDFNDENYDDIDDDDDDDDCRYLKVLGWCKM